MLRERPIGELGSRQHRLAVAVDRRRRILRFFGPRGDLPAAEAPGVVVLERAIRMKFREIGKLAETGTLE